MNNCLLLSHFLAIFIFPLPYPFPAGMYRQHRRGCPIALKFVIPKPFLGTLKNKNTTANEWKSRVGINVSYLFLESARGRLDKFQMICHLLGIKLLFFNAKENGTASPTAALQTRGKSARNEKKKSVAIAPFHCCALLRTSATALAVSAVSELVRALLI